MQVPAITVPENISESVLYFPANVCGLVIGELFIPDTVVAIINIPEITVPDFAECPFYVVLPPPIYYASSAYPLYEIDACTISSTLINARFVIDPAYSEGISLSSNFIKGTLRGFSYLSTEVSADSINITSNLISGSMSGFRYLYLNTLPNDPIFIGSTLLSGTVRNYRYLVLPEVPVDSVSLTSNLISGNLV